MQTIRELRRERGWTQFQLALAVGVQPQTIYLWESGRRIPQVPQLRKLGKVFGLCSDEIALEFEAESHDSLGPDRHGQVLTRGATEEGGRMRRGGTSVSASPQRRKDNPDRRA